MAPAGRKQNARQADYSNIGVAGRKTGVVLHDTGMRDEHGMEPIDGIFSSPDHPRSDGTNTDEEEMHTLHSPIPDPAEMLARNRRAAQLPPAKARSPIKTNLMSPARRSILGTSPWKQRRPPQSSPPSHETSVARNGPALGPSPLRQQRKPRTTNLLSSGQKPQPPSIKSRKSREEVFDFPVSEDEDEQDDIGEEEQEDNIDPSVVQLMDEDMMDGGDDGQEDEEEEEEEDLEPEDEVEEEMVVQPTKSPNAQKKRGRKPKEPVLEPQDEEDEDSEPEEVETQIKSTKPPKKRGRPSKDAVSKPVDQPVPAKRRGRPPKNAVSTASQPAAATKKRTKQVSTADEEPEAEPQPKRRKKAAEPTATTTPPKSRTMLPPAAGITQSPGRARTNAGSTATEAQQSKPRSRGLLLLRSETPAEDVGATVMRSGRTSVKPMAYWRNERLVFGEGRVEGKSISLPGIKEVIRTEEVEPESRTGRKRGRSKSGARRIGRQRSVALDEDDEDAEAWETDVGVLSADVRRWNPEAGDGSDDKLDEIELAYAPKGLDLAAREVKDGKFLYGKTVTLPFFHSGVVDLPPGGEKRMRNSRKHHMVFCVFAGRVDVELNEFVFSIGRGGMWQVPRGNWYGLKNPYDRPTRLFFAQGCYMHEEETGQVD